jgi:NADPH-dependent 2,4-dienoyl-CoA reductase/sulfur reductase-like enzyme
VLAACRKRVGDRFLLGMRYAADEVENGGITLNDGIEIARIFKASGFVDFLNIIRGRIHTDAALTNVIPIHGTASAPHLDLAGRIRAEVCMPTFHAARIPDVATARHSVATGQLDMVGMTRAHMADPHIVQKITEGRENDIRPCVGATYCLDRIYQGGMALCIHNPATGREETMPQTLEKAVMQKKIVIVGAGPAGLEAARVASGRGHRVTVLEAAPDAGGQVRLTAKSPRRRELIGIIDWRMAQCAAHDVTFHFNSYAEARDVLALSPDVVIIATGGLPTTDVLTTGNDLVVSAWDILSGDVKAGNNVLLFDDAGDHTALQAAQMIAEAGAKIEIMTPDRSFAPEVMAMNLVPYMRAMQDKNVTFTVTYRLASVKKDGNQLCATIGSDYVFLEKTAHYDQVIVNHGTQPLDGLYFELKPLSLNQGAVDYGALLDGRAQHEHRGQKGFALYRIGDAVSSRNIHAAIYDGLRLMKDI